jgi:hypothetical protein
MKILKWIAIVIAIIIAIPLLVALFTTKDYKVEQEITINKPNADVFNYVKMLRNQVYYSKWAKMDPNRSLQLRTVREWMSAFTFLNHLRAWVTGILQPKPFRPARQK